MSRRRKKINFLPVQQKKWDNISSLLGTLTKRLEEYIETTYSYRDKQFFSDVLEDISDIRLDLKSWRRDPEGFLTACGYEFEKMVKHDLSALPKESV